MHYPVAIFTENPDENNISNILEPFNEQTEDSDFIEFYDLTEDIKTQYEIDNKNLSFKEYAERQGYIQQDNRWGYYSNPDGQWDWWSIGGRWTGLLELKKGSKKISGIRADIALLKDVDFEKMLEIYTDKSIKYITDSFITPDGNWVSLEYEGENYYNKEWENTLKKLDFNKIYIVIIDCHV